MPRLLALASDAARDKDVLEVAAGTGVLTLALARTAHEVIATDYAESMMAALEQRVRDAALENVRCERADLYSLPFADRSFDVVVAANVLHLVPDVPAAIDAMRRVLVRGGRLVVPTFCHDETRVSRSVSRLLRLTGFPGRRRFSARSLQSTLEGVGLHVTRSELLPGLIPIVYVEGAFEPAFEPA